MNPWTETKKSYIQSLVSPEAFQFLLAMKEMWIRRSIPNISWNTAHFIVDTLRKRNVRHILEIGPANGFSTIMLSLASETVKVTSIECSRHAFEELRYNIGVFETLKNEELWIMNYELWDKEIRSLPLPIPLPHNPAEFPPKVTSDINQVIGERFHLYYGDAREILPAFLTGAQEILCANPESRVTDIPKEQFDMIFIDGAFRMTREFFDLSRPLLAEWGIMILDDAIKYRWKMEGFHEYLEAEGIHYELVQTDEDDGVMVITECPL